MTQDTYNSRYMPNPDQVFKEIKLSECCLQPIEEYWIENSTICMGCYGLNPNESHTVYQCSLCLEEHDQEECNCY